MFPPKIIYGQLLTLELNSHILIIRIQNIFFIIFCQSRSFVNEVRKKPTLAKFSCPHVILAAGHPQGVGENRIWRPREDGEIFADDRTETLLIPQELPTKYIPACSPTKYVHVMGCSIIYKI